MNAVTDDNVYSMFWEKNRIQSFKKNWKNLNGFKNCTPESFAKAGFYNYSTKDSRDNVRCFCCQKELDGWEKEDDPWEEHKKRGQACIFVQLKTKYPDKKCEMEMRDVLQLYFGMKNNLISRIAEKSKTSLEETKDSYKSLLKKMKKYNI